MKNGVRLWNSERPYQKQMIQKSWTRSDLRYLEHPGFLQMLWSFVNFFSFSNTLESAQLWALVECTTLIYTNHCGFLFKVQEKLKQWSDSFVEAFESHRFDEAVKCIQRMTYYERACEEIVKKL